MKVLQKQKLTLSVFLAFSALLFLAGTASSLPYAALLDPPPTSNGYAPRWNVGNLDYASDDPGGNRNLGTRITYQYAEPANASLDLIPLVIALHGNGGNSGSFCPNWKDQNGNSIIDRRNDIGKEYIVVGIDGHPPIGKPIDDKSGGWHYHYSEYNFDVPADGDPSNDVHRVDHVQGIENVISNLLATTTIRIDTSRIYLMGFSGGGLMTHFLTMEGIGTYSIAASANIAAALGGIKNQETSDPLNCTWDTLFGGFQLGTATAYSDCDPYTNCTPIPSSALIYPLNNGLAVPTLIQLGDIDPHFPVNGGEDTHRFNTAVGDPTRNGDRTGVSTLTETINGYRLKNSTTHNLNDCSLMKERDKTNGSNGFKVTEYYGSPNCNAVIKVVEMESWGHAKAKTRNQSTYDSVDSMLLFFDSYGVDPVGGTGGGLGQ